MPKQFKLTIKLGNDAMQTPGDISRALQDVAGRLGDVRNVSEIDETPVMDNNGNTVGWYRISRSRE